MKRLIRIKGRAGFTLVECLVAILVFAIMSMIVASILNMAIFQHQKNKENTRGVNEQLRQLTIDNSGDGDVEGVKNYNSNEAEEGIPITLDFGEVDEEGNPILREIDVEIYNYKEPGKEVDGGNVENALQVDQIRANDKFGEFYSEGGDDSTSGDDDDEGGGSPTEVFSSYLITGSRYLNSVNINTGSASGRSPQRVDSAVPVSADVIAAQNLTEGQEYYYSAGVYYLSNVYSFDITIQISDSRAANQDHFRSSLSVKLPENVVGIVSETPSVGGCKITKEGNSLKIRRSDSNSPGNSTGNFAGYSCKVTLYFVNDPGDNFAESWLGSSASNVFFYEVDGLPGAYAN